MMEGGLYSPAYEHDACGIGMVVNIHGNKSHALVENALVVLENMRHRGAEGQTTKPATAPEFFCRFHMNSFC